MCQTPEIVRQWHLSGQNRVCDLCQLKLEGAQRKKANRELQKLSEDITEFRDVEH